MRNSISSGARGRAHAFAFYGGERLNKMGAAWFVSYAYHKHIDAKHFNWNRVATKMRISVYDKSFSYHRYWLDKIMSMDNQKLDKNAIGLAAIQVKSMAKKLMATVW